MMAKVRNPLRRIAFIGCPSLRHQHDGCQAQGKGGAGGVAGKAEGQNSRF